MIQGLAPAIQIYDELSEEPNAPFTDELTELSELVSEFDRIVVDKPYLPNRTQRRAVAKRDRLIMKRRVRG